MRAILMMAAAGAAAISAPAAAQLAVVDSSNLAQALATARNTLTAIAKAEAQIAEQQRLFEAVNGITDIQEAARALDNPLLRGARPEGMTGPAGYLGTAPGELGALGAAAQSIFAASNFRTGAADADQALELLGRTAARDQAIAQNGLELAQARAEGLGQLTARLGAATTQRERDELGARAAIETAAAVNETNRLLALEAQRRAEGERKAAEGSAAMIRARNEAWDRYRSGRQ